MAESSEYLREIESLEAQELRRPLAIVGFGGWIDAGYAATGAVRYLVDHLEASRIAELDPEPFYAFTDTRPRVSHPSPGRREPVWPKVEWFAVHMPEDQAHDLVLFTAPEPNLRWRGFTTVVLDVFQKLGTDTLVSFGAVLAPVHHRATPPMRGWATTDNLRSLLRRRQIGSGRYEGPTGITTVLLAAARDRGLPAFSLSTSSPSYLTDMPNPRASAALLRMAGEIGTIQFPLSDLDAESLVVAERIDQFLAERPELKEAVDRLPYTAEETPASSEYEPSEPPAELPSSAAVLQDLEDFLRNLRRDNGGSTDN
ncbi:MAG: PAC2 family protein [Chloroflexi bacterium]|nr:PAC2 family protein [Chloroflexota bacterium]MBV9896702.1 PAC2 family protein [Chloroflexota bacterium]